MKVIEGSKRHWCLELYKLVGEYLEKGMNVSPGLTGVVPLLRHLATEADQLPGILTPAEEDYFAQLEAAARKMVEATLEEDPELLKWCVVVDIAYHAAPADPLDNEILTQVLGDRDTKGIRYNRINRPDQEGGIEPMQN